MAALLAFLRIPSLTPPPENKHVPWLFLSGWKGPGSRGCTPPRWRSVPRLLSASQDVLFAFPPLLPGSASDGGWKEIRRVDFSPHLSELSDLYLTPSWLARVWRLGPCELLSQPGPQSERGGSHSERNRGASSRSLRVGAGVACVRRKPNLLLEEGPAASLHRWPGALTCTRTVHLKAVPQGRGRRGSRPDLSPFRFLRMPCPRKAFGAHPGVTPPPHPM